MKCHNLTAVSIYNLELFLNSAGHKYQLCPEETSIEEQNCKMSQRVRKKGPLHSLAQSHLENPSSGFHLVLGVNMQEHPEPRFSF